MNTQSIFDGIACRLLNQHTVLDDLTVPLYVNKEELIALLQSRYNISCKKTNFIEDLERGVYVLRIPLLERYKPLAITNLVDEKFKLFCEVIKTNPWNPELKISTTNQFADQCLFEKLFIDRANKRYRELDLDNMRIKFNWNDYSGNGDCTIGLRQRTLPSDICQRYSDKKCCFLIFVSVSILLSSLLAILQQ